MLEPNQHIPSIAHAIASRQFGVSKDEFAYCLAFYWQVVVATWKNENEYIRACFEVEIPTFDTHQYLAFIYSLEIRFPAPIPLTLGNQHQFDTPIHKYECIICNPYTQWEEFRIWHNGFSHLTLRCCQGTL